jgi:hypothetical protein
VSVLDPPRHPVVGAALHLAKLWCHGQIIDDAPALAHAARVARTVVIHQPTASASLVAAALLHDAPTFAPQPLNLCAYLDAHVNPGVGRLVAAIDAEHARMDQGSHPTLDPDPGVTIVLAADKVVAFRALLRRARRSGDPQAFFVSRHALRRVMPYFHQWCALAEPALPTTLASDLQQVLSNLDGGVGPRAASTVCTTRSDATSLSRKTTY